MYQNPEERQRCSNHPRDGTSYVRISFMHSDGMHRASIQVNDIFDVEKQIDEKLEAYFCRKVDWEFA